MPGPLIKLCITEDQPSPDSHILLPAVDVSSARLSLGSISQEAKNSSLDSSRVPHAIRMTDETNSSSRSLISPLLSSSNTQIKNSATFDYSTLRVPPIPTSSRLKGSSEIIPLTEDAVSLRKRALEISSHQRTGRSMSASPGDAVDLTNDSLALLQKKYDDSICQRGTSMKSLSFTRSVSAVSNYSSLDPYFRVHSPPIRGLSHYQTSTPSRLSSDLNPFSFPSSFLAPQNSQNNRLSSHHENRSGYMPSIENLSADLMRGHKGNFQCAVPCHPMEPVTGFKQLQKVVEPPKKRKLLEPGSIPDKNVTSKVNSNQERVIFVDSGSDGKSSANEPTKDENPIFLKSNSIPTFVNILPGNESQRSGPDRDERMHSYFNMREKRIRELQPHDTHSKKKWWKVSLNVPPNVRERQCEDSLKPSRTIGWRLSKRKELNEKRSRLADYSLAFALFGLVCTIIENEMTNAEIYQKSSEMSYFLRSLTTISTCILLIIIIMYHALEIQLFSVNNCVEDWRIALNAKRVGFLMIELLVCSIHPLPVNYSFSWTLEIPPNNIPSVKRVPLDLPLTMPMFLRLYLIFRVLLLHSKMFTGTSSRSIGALNRVKFNIRFILKTVITVLPGTVLFIIIFSWWFLASWIMRACERIHEPHHNNFLNSMWLIAITFLSIGYGDLVPNTYCGRTVSVLSGVMGSCCTALVVAVFARKLELKRSEKHVHNFMMDNKIYKELRHAAANVLRETWLFYKYTRLVKRVNVGKVRRHQRKFLYAIHSLRKAKENQRKLKDDASSLVDLAKTQGSIYETASQIRADQDRLQERVEAMEFCLTAMKDSINSLPEAVYCRLLSDAPNLVTNVRRSGLLHPIVNTGSI